jgi:hypothetical protein
MVATKAGTLSVADRNNMGRYQTSAGGNVQEAFVGAMQSAPAIWGDANGNYSIFVAPEGGQLAALNIANASINFGSPTSQSGDTYPMQGASPSVSSQGASNGLVWTLDNSANGASHSTGWGPAILRAYDATNLAKHLYASVNAASDACGYAVKFTTPVVANGKVYVGGAGPGDATQVGNTGGQLTVYGLTK